jgi:hypothetical protein
VAASGRATERVHGVESFVWPGNEIEERKF